MSNTKPAIAFLTHDWSWGTQPLQPNGCAWYRCLLPSDELNNHGWTSKVGFPVFSKKNNFGLLLDETQAMYGWDIVVFKLLMQQDIYDAMLIALENGQKIVVDVDDHFDALSKANRAHEASDPKLHPDLNRDIYKKIIMSATAVITSTPVLFDYYSKLRSNVFMVRNGIDSYRWTPKIHQSYGDTTIGWVGATHWRSNDLEQLADFFEKYIQSKNLVFHHSGHTSTAPLAKVLIGINDMSTKTSMSNMAPILEYPTLFEKIDIGIVPLNDIPFNHAKSFIKGLEYAAAGVPFVSSHSPEYQYLADHGIGRIANTRDQWMNNFNELLNPQMRRDEAAHNRDLLENFTMKKRGVEWDETFKKILEHL